MIVDIYQTWVINFQEKGIYKQYNDFQVRLLLSIVINKVVKDMTEKRETDNWKTNNDNYFQLNKKMI